MQFSLDTSKYYDQNLFVRYNKVETQDSRINIARPVEKYHFLDLVKTSDHWLLDLMETSANITFDGFNYEMRSELQILGIYFFYYEEMYEHTREARHLVDVVSDWGGLHTVIFSIFAIFVASFNEELKNTKFIRNLFMEHTSINTKKKIKSKFCDILKKTMGFYKCFRKQKVGKDPSELMEKGKEKLGDIVDVFNIIKQIQKLKALISVMSN
jgi:hypothetical protein